MHSLTAMHLDALRLAAADLVDDVRVRELATPERDEVELAVGDGLGALSQHPHHPAHADDGHAHTLLHRLGEVGERAGSHQRDERVDRVVVAGTDVERLHLMLEHLAEGQAILERQAALVGLLNAEAVEDGEVGSHLLAHRVDHLEGKSGPVLQTPAVLVVATVGLGRKELARQVAVRPVYLDRVEAGQHRTARRLGVLVDDPRDLLERQAPGRIA